MSLIPLRSVGIVWLRYFAVFRKNFFYGVITTFTEPLLFLISFGFGLGKLVGPIEYMGTSFSYREFILSGIVAQSILFQGFFEAAYGSFIRMYYQKIFHAIATTPVTLGDVLWAELLWDATKATFAATMVLLIGIALGDFKPLGAIACIPLCFFGALLFAGLGLWMSALSKTIEQISYPQYLLIFPMFLFCGIYYPVTTLPQVFQYIAWALPLTSLCSIVRSLTLGLPMVPQAPPILLGWALFLVWVSRRTMTRRLIK